jgi:hypothetical protein
MPEACILGISGSSMITNELDIEANAKIEELNVKTLNKTQEMIPCCRGLWEGRGAGEATLVITRMS